MTDIIKGKESNEEAKKTLEDAIRVIADDDGPGAERVHPQLEALTDAFLALVGEDITQEALISARITFFTIAEKYQPDFNPGGEYRRVIELAFLRASNKPKDVEGKEEGGAFLETVVDETSAHVGDELQRAIR